MRQLCNADADTTDLHKKESAQSARHHISLQDAWGVGIEPQLGDTCGYDITVKDTNFTDGLAFGIGTDALLGAVWLRELDDDEYRNELYAVNDLQRNGLPKDEDGERVSMADIETKQTKESGKDCCRN